MHCGPDSSSESRRKRGSVEPLRRAHLRVVLLSDDGYERIFTNLQTIGALAGRRREAAALVARLLRETAELQARAAALCVASTRLRRFG